MGKRACLLRLPYFLSLLYRAGHTYQLRYYKEQSSRTFAIQLEAGNPVPMHIP